ncbi:MAG: KpsF/GutQ family sugar-phosphate isomerase [Flavihumibacter sp.]
MNSNQIQETARQTIRQEADALAALLPGIDQGFADAVEAIRLSNGRLVVSGIGKSAIVAQKIVATLNSTGTPALYMHAADAIHGDLGMVQQHDVVLIISKSGESPEIKYLVPLVKGFGNQLVAMVGNMQSFLAKQADFVLNTTVSKEACPNNLAPTSSTTAQMVMGDALAVCLMELSGFNGQDFAKYHPGGNLGKRLYMRVRDLYVNNERPLVSPATPLKEIILSISKSRLGITVVCDANETLLGVVTDGDLRRMLEKSHSLTTVSAADIMTVSPKTIGPDELAVNALSVLKRYDITQLVVVGENNHYLGVLHLHDLIKEGLL